MNKNILLFIIIFSFTFVSCESFLNISPDDRITDDNFWSEAKDADMALNGVYKVLAHRSVYGYGGGMDACTPNAYQWAHWEGMQMQIGNGSVFSGTGGLVDERWKFCYTGINRANYFLENIERVTSLIGEEKKERMVGEALFLRGVYLDLLVRSYGGVPILLKSIDVKEARNIERNSVEECWAQVHKDYDEAIKRLPKQEAELGRASLGAALGMKMKAYLYVSDWNNVLKYCEEIDKLDRYKLFPSYQGLFQFENEGNSESIFVVGFMDGAFSQGSVFDRYWQPQNLKYNIDGSNSVAPTQLLVDEYETIDGSPIDPNDPYKNRDPRLDFTVLRPGAYFQGQLYPKEIKNHTGQKVGFAIRKYTIETMQVVGNQSPLDFMILRYGDVLLSKAEALIELNKNLDQATELINKIRTGRDDVKLVPIKTGLGQDDLRKVLRKERRIELALEGQFWDDIKRWKAGKDYYPCTVIGGLGEKIDVKFPDGYDLDKDNLLPIPDSEMSMNKALKQNPKY